MQVLLKNFTKRLRQISNHKDDKRRDRNASSFCKARKIINTYISKNGENYIKNGKTTHT